MEASDDDGPVPVDLQKGRFTLQRSARGRLRISYSLPAIAGTLGTTPGVEVDPDRFRALGGSVFALPDAWLDRTLPVSVRIDMTDAHVMSQGTASSLGVGDTIDRLTRIQDLREIMLVGGPMGKAIFDSPDGHDEAAWFGYTAFDPRPGSADMAGFRTAVHQFFGDKSSPPATLLFVIDGRAPGAFAVSRRAGGVVAHLGVGETWSGPVRISIAARILKEWIGERLWVGPTEPEAEALWFVEGMARHLSRDLLFRFGLLTPSEVIDEMNGMESAVALSPWKGQGNKALAARASEPGVLPLIVARGALYAARVDAIARGRGDHKKSLDDILRRLYKEAHDSHGPLPASRWVEVVGELAGPQEARVFAEVIDKGSVPVLPDDALGPCFRSGKRRYSEWDPGFDEEATRGATPRKAVGVREGGPAWRAGLRDGDTVVEWRLSHGRSDVPVTLVVERETRKTITWLPAGPAVDGRGWVRRKEIPDERCAR